jgi:hypothetical protein
VFFGNFSSSSRLKRAASAAAAPPLQEMDIRELARRTVPRDAIEFRTTLNIDADGGLDARIMDISPYGFQSRASSRMLERGERIRVTLPLVGDAEADIMWSLKGLFGCKFVQPIDTDLYAEMLACIRGSALTTRLDPSPAGEQSDGGVPLE